MRLSAHLIATARRTLTALMIAGVVAIEAEAQQSDQAELAHGRCVVLDGLVQSASSGFERYRGKEVASNIYEATIWISGFDTCSVVLADLSMYTCKRSAGSEGVARTLFDLAVNKMRGCLAHWREASPHDASAQGLQMIQGVRLIEQLDAGEIVVGIAHVRDTRGDVGQDSVSLVVTFNRHAALAS
jgi:hypothetical protein